MSETQASLAIRRAIDIALSATAMIPLAPLMVVIAVMIRRDSPGPAIFRQERVGRYGRIFVMYKFRTMHTGTLDGPAVTSLGDARVTGVGVWLRSTKLDELPQLVNVLKGDMSLVGPRPELPVFVELWDPGRRDLVLSIRPGITDPITLSLIREEEVLSSASEPEAYYRAILLPKKLDAYAAYAQCRTISGDVGTLLRTLRAVVLG